jgi:hypothetical protein
MGFSSQAGQAILRQQAVAGTFQADTGTAGVGLKLRSGSLAPSRTLTLPDPEIGGGRDLSDAYLGAVSWSGDYEFYARLESLTTLLKAGFGTAATTVDTPVAGANKHDFTPSDAALLPFLSLEEAIGASLETYRYTDVVVNTLHLEAEANGYLMGTAGLIARTQQAGQTRTPAPLWDNGPLLVGTNITLTYGGVTLPAKSFSFDLNNNIADDDYRLGSFFIGDLTPASREVTASFSIREKDSSLWRQAVYGVSSATTPGGLTTKSDLVITMQTYENVTGTTKGSITLTIPKFALNPYGLNASGADIIESDISGQALRPNPADPICTLTVVSANDTIA